jgi:hypothetical protein
MHVFAGMSATTTTGPDRAEHLFIETRLEERDGATWVSGICPFCWDRFAFRAPSAGEVATVPCPNGHPLRIERQRSAGEHH